MRNVLPYVTTFTSFLNAIVAFFLAYKLFSSKKKSYLNDQFKHFFIYFGLYFLLINLLISAFLDKPYFFYVLLDVFHFILSIGLAYLFSGFIYLRHRTKTKTAFWLFIIIGFAISLFGITNVNPETANTLNTFSSYTYPYPLYAMKITYLGIGFMYPALSFLKQGFITKDSFIKKRYYLLAGAFSSWVIGGAMHSRFDIPLFSILGDGILMLGFVLAGIILLEKHPEELKK